MAGEDESPIEWGFTLEEAKQLQRYVDLRTALAYITVAQTSLSKAHAILMGEHEPDVVCHRLEEIYFKLSAINGCIRASMKDTMGKEDD